MLKKLKGAKESGIFCNFVVIMRLLRLIYILIIPVMAWAFTACHDSNDEPTPPEPVIAPRTVLVYMVAANNLGRPDYDSDVSYDTLDLREMEKAARAGISGGRWLVFHSAYSGSRLLELTKRGFRELKKYDDIVPVEVSDMSAVIDDAQSLAPADSYGLVLWSHGSGWIEDVPAASGALKGPALRVFGDHRGKHINTTDLRRVLEGKGFDFIYFDCCLMGSVEVMYELRDCAHYIVSSPSELAKKGMPYDENLQLLLDGSRESLVAAATNTFNWYDRIEDPEMRTATMTVVDTEWLEALADATAAIYALSPASHPLKTVTNYYGSDRVSQGYYLDFGEYVEALAADQALSETLTGAWRDAMSRTVIYADATPRLWNSWPMYNVSGLSTRVFRRAADISTKGYDRLEWARDVVAPRFTTSNSTEQ